MMRLLVWRCLLHAPSLGAKDLHRT